MRFKDLNKTDIKHLHEQLSAATLANFKIVAASQKETRDKPDFEQCNEPCYDCKRIAIKLGLPV